MACSGGTFLNPEGRAFDAESASITNDVTLGRQFRARGQVWLVGTSIGGQLMCRGGTFENPKGDALNAESVAVTGSVFLDRGFNAEGSVILAGAQIGGTVWCRGGTFDTPRGTALTFEAASVTISIMLNEEDHADGRKKRFCARGEVNLEGARIGGDLSCSGGAFVNLSGLALDAESASITGSVFLDRVNAKGTVWLAGASIGGGLWCSGGKFTKPGGLALSADSASITGPVILDRRFKAKGAVILAGASIDRGLSCHGGTFINHSGDALNAAGASIAVGVVLDRGPSDRDSNDRGFNAKGTVNLAGATISGSLDCSGGSFAADGNKDTADALSLERTTVATTLTLKPNEVRGVVDLTDATVGTLRDSQTSWPQKLRLAGLIYQYIVDDGVSDRQRIKWLQRHVDAGGSKTYNPRPYEQLATMYRATGQDSAARNVGVARADAHHESLPRNPAGWFRRGWSRFLRVTVGYGYQPWLAMLWLLGLWTVASLVVYAADAQDAMRQLIADPELAPELVPPVYALDLLIPVVDLGQRSHWQPEWPFSIAYWIAVLAGWALITAVIAGITSSFRRA